MNTNTFYNALSKNADMTLTENGGLAYSTTGSAVYDLFALAGAMRNRAEDVIPMFRAAYKEDRDLALKCIFYLRDIRGGQGERKIFRMVMRDIAQHCSNNDEFMKIFALIPEYGRFDDLIKITYQTYFFKHTVAFLTAQLLTDVQSDHPSLCAKWMPSENASSRETKEQANAIRKAMGISHKDYRQLLSFLRQKINIVERLMSSHNWDAIDFAKLPSKAGMRYAQCFRRRSELCGRYIEFINSKTTHVNAGTLYPYEIVHKALNLEEDRAVLQKYWENLPDYFNGKSSNIICVVDSSGSMTSRISKESSVTAWDVSASLGIYTAERLAGPFRDSFITFSSKPKFVRFEEEKDIVAKVRRTDRESLYDNTNLERVFQLLFNTANKPGVKVEDIPNMIVVISDMEIDRMTNLRDKSEAMTMMEQERAKWRNAHLPMPKLIYWNVMARNNIILDDAGDDGVSFVSGCSPVIFKSILTGKMGKDLMYEVLNSKRYEPIHF